MGHSPLSHWTVFQKSLQNHLINYTDASDTSPAPTCRTSCPALTRPTRPGAVGCAGVGPCAHRHRPVHDTDWRPRRALRAAPAQRSRRKPCPGEAGAACAVGDRRGRGTPDVKRVVCGQVCNSMEMPVRCQASVARRRAGSARRASADLSTSCRGCVRSCCRRWRPRGRAVINIGRQHCVAGQRDTLIPQAQGVSPERISFPESLSFVSPAHASSPLPSLPLLDSSSQTRASPAKGHVPYLWCGLCSLDPMRALLPLVPASVSSSIYCGPRERTGVIRGPCAVQIAKSRT